MWLSEDSLTVLKDNRLNNNAMSGLTKEQLNLIYKNKWFKIWVPKSLGGLALTLPDGLSLLEELAYHDGSVGWTVTLCSGANLFVGFIDTSVAKRIFIDDQVCLGGSGQSSGIARSVDGGYRVSGHWRYATGAPHLTHFTLNALLHQDGQEVLDGSGVPVMKTFFVPKDQVLVHYDWNTFGLESTASHSFSLSDVFIPQAYNFSIDASKATSTDLLYQYPFLPFAELTLLVNFIGMYRRFLDLMEKIFVLRAARSEQAAIENRHHLRMLDQQRQECDYKKHEIYQLATRSWEALAVDQGDSDLYEAIGIKSRDFVERIRTSVTQLFPYAGIAGAQKEEEINVVFRNIFTATQHRLLQRNGGMTRR